MIVYGTNLSKTNRNQEEQIMPQLIFKGISVNQVKSISSGLVVELAKLCECEVDKFQFGSTTVYFYF